MSHLSNKLTAIALAALMAATIGCGSGDSNSSASSMNALADRLDAQAELEAQQAAQAAIEAEARAARAQADALANREATQSTRKDALGRRQARSSGGYLGAVAKAYVEVPQQVTTGNVVHNMDIIAAANGYPKSTEEYLRVVRDNGLSLPPLEEPYEYWYNTVDHKLYTRVKPEVIAAAEAEAAAAEAAAGMTSETMTVVGSLVRGDSGDFKLPDGSTVYTWTSGDRSSDKWVYLWCDTAGASYGEPRYRAYPIDGEPGPWKPLLGSSEVYQITGYRDDQGESANSPIGAAEKFESGQYIFQVMMNVDGRSVATAGVTFDIP